MIFPCCNCQGSNTVCVPGRGNEEASLLFCGEAPGKDEVKRKPPMCWIGKAGQELENYIVKVSNIDYESVYLTNLCKFHPPQDRNPTKLEIESCSPVVEMEIACVNPKYIAALGAYAVRYFLGDDVTLERIHGIPIEKDGRIILPMYHPAAGLHNSTMMTQIVFDFEQLGKLIRGKCRVGSITDYYPTEKCDYRLAKSGNELREYLTQSDGIIAIDTESVKRVVYNEQNGKDVWYGEVVPWCISVSMRSGTARVVMVRDEELIRLVGSKLADPKVMTLIHNIMYDLPILQDMGVIPSNCRDTMVMSYLTQSLPQGLKDLAYRLKGMVMSDYKEMVAIPTADNALNYLNQVSSVEWPKPEPILEWSKGVAHVKVGWALHKRVNKIVSNYMEDDSVDLRDRWENIEERLRLPAEKEFGLMPIGDLSEVDIDKAVRYSARDADATLRIYPDLEEIVRNMNIPVVE